MRIAYLDCVGGISGDMFVGALLDAGWSEDAFRRSVAWLDDEIADLRIETRSHHALDGLGIVVTPAKTGHGGHHHRTLADVTACLRAAPLDDAVRERAEAVFRRLAEGEARAHGKTVQTVHFHEVGAVDAMVDVVATCQGLADLAIERLYISPLPVGRGEIRGAHGTIPLPAPATAHLLSGVPVRWMGAEGERTTPTGAALATTLGCWEVPPPVVLEAVGTGAGTRALDDVPNLARLFVGSRRSANAAGVSREIPGWGWGGDPSRDLCPGGWGQVIVLEAQVDDATAEEVAVWTAELLEKGALDAYVTAVTMKKGRLGSLITAICRPDAEEALTAHFLGGTTTIGVRRRFEWRRELERRTTEVETPFGRIAIKMAQRGDRWVGKPEFESCRQAASGAGASFGTVWRAALVAVEALGDWQPPGSASGP